MYVNHVERVLQSVRLAASSRQSIGHTRYTALQLAGCVVYDGAKSANFRNCYPNVLSRIRSLPGKQGKVWTVVILRINHAKTPLIKGIGRLIAKDDFNAIVTHIVAYSFHPGIVEEMIVYCILGGEIRLV